MGQGDKFGNCWNISAEMIVQTEIEKMRQNERAVKRIGRTGDGLDGRIEVHGRGKVC